jgi:hypothetical protein
MSCDTLSVSPPGVERSPNKTSLNLGLYLLTSVVLCSSVCSPRDVARLEECRPSEVFAELLPDDL